MKSLKRFKTKVTQYGSSRVVRASNFELGEEVYVFNKDELKFIKDLLK